MACIKMGSDESHFNVSLIGRDKVTVIDSVHKPQLLKRKESPSGIEPRSFRLPAYRLTARPNRLSRRRRGAILPFVPDFSAAVYADRGEQARFWTRRGHNDTTILWADRQLMRFAIPMTGGDPPARRLNAVDNKETCRDYRRFKASAARSVDFLAPSVVLA